MAYIGVSPSNGVRQKHTYTVSGTSTDTFSGAGAEGISLSYLDSNYVDVYQNGVKLGDADYTANNGTSIVLGTNASDADIVEIIVYDVFSVADTVSKADGGTFDGNVTMAGTITVTGNADLNGDLDVDGTANLDVVDIDGALTQDGGAVFNEGSADVDFRVESNGQANMLFVDGGTDTVIVGHNVSRTTMFNSTVGGSLQVEGTTAEGATVSIARNSNDDNGPNLVLAKSNGTANAAVTVVTDDALLGRISWQGADGSQTVEAARIEGFVDSTPGANDMPGRLTFSTTADGASSVTERLRIDSAGAVHVATTSTNQANVGISLNANGNITAARDGGIVGLFNRKSDDGEIISLRQDGSTIGGIYSSPSITGPFIGHINVGLAMYHAGNSVLPSGTGGLRDNAIDLGNSSNRFDDIFATNSTINTSDRNEKQDIEELSEAEQRVAVVAKGLMRKFRWKSAVAEKGDDARTHFGIIAQDLQDAFTAEGLDAGDYAMFTSTTWWEKEISVDAVEADEENGIEAQEAYTYTKIAEEETEGYTEKTRLGVRYSELLAFIISAI